MGILEVEVLVAVQTVSEEEEEARGETVKAGELPVRLVGGVTMVQATVVGTQGASCSELPRLDSEDFTISPEVAGETRVKALGTERDGRVKRLSRGESSFFSVGRLVEV